MSLLNDPAFLDGAAGSVNRAVLTFVASNPVAQVSCSGEIQVIYLDAEGQTITDTYTNLSKRSIQVPTPAGSPVYIIGNVTLLSVASKLSAIDLRSCRSLTTLTLSGQTEITGVNIAGCKQLVYLDLSGCTKLAGIDLTENTALVSINLANCVALASLSLEENVLLESVDITNCSALPYLDATMLTVLSSLKYEGTMLQSPNNSLILIAAHYGTDLAAARAAAEEAAASVKKVERLLEQLPDGQAVTATVALHTEEIAKLKESSMTRVELVCEDDTKITVKGSSTALTYAQIKALVDDTTKFVTLQYMGLWWMLPSYDDGGAIMFTATDIQNGHPQVTRVIINTAGQLNNYTIVAEDADHKTNDLSVEVAADGDLTYPTTRAVNGKFVEIEQKLNDLAKTYIEEELTPIETTDSKYIDKDNGTLVDSTSTQRVNKYEIENISLEYKASGRTGTNTQMCLVAFYDTNDDFISSQNPSTGTPKVWLNKKIDVPSTAKFIRVQGQNSSNFPSLIATVPISTKSQVFENKNNIEEIGKQVLKNTSELSDIHDALSFFHDKNLSVIGASTCTYNGIIPSRNKTYYPKNGVTNVSQMWWQILCDKLGMNRLVIEAWSGSKVSDIGAGEDYVNFVPMADTSRCNNLHTDSAEPDIIIIQGGINDFSKNGDVLGTWNGGDIPIDISNFSNAMAVMLNRINIRYPNAKVYVCGIPLFVRTGTTTTTELSANENKSIADYNNVIRKMCDIFSCNYINLQGLFTRTGYYPTYCQDSESTPTHMNALGHKVWADRIRKELLQSVSW